MLGTWYGSVGTRFESLGARIGSLKRLKKTCLYIKIAYCVNFVLLSSSLTYMFNSYSVHYFLDVYK